MWLQGQGLLPWFFQCISLNAEKGGEGTGWKGWDGKGLIRGISSTRKCFPMELRLFGIGSVTPQHGIAPVQSPACSHCSLSMDMALAFLATVLHVPFPPKAHPSPVFMKFLCAPLPISSLLVMFRPCCSCHSCQGGDWCLWDLEEFLPSGSTEHSMVMNRNPLLFMGSRQKPSQLPGPAVGGGRWGAGGQ